MQMDTMHQCHPLIWRCNPINVSVIIVPSVQRMLANKIATAMVQAEQNMQPAAIGLGTYTANHKSKREREELARGTI